MMGSGKRRQEIIPGGLLTRHQGIQAVLPAESHCFHLQGAESEVGAWARSPIPGAPACFPCFSQLPTLLRKVCLSLSCASCTGLGALFCLVLSMTLQSPLALAYHWRRGSAEDLRHSL